MSKSCKGLAMELVKCLSESDCVKVEKRTYRECAKEKCPSISSECMGLRETYFNCKRGQTQMMQIKRRVEKYKSKRQLNASPKQNYVQVMPFSNIYGGSGSGCKRKFASC